jgi:uncharacterized membrane protein YdjX (TVP38/TMEM64 family)
METPAATKSGFSIGKLIPLAILAAGLVAFFALGLHKYLTLDLVKENREVLKTWVHDHKTEAVLLFILAYIIVAAFSLPISVLVSITGGFLFGSVFGTIWGVIGATIGATILFLVAKSALGDPLRRRFASQVKSLEEGFRANAVSYMMLLRLVPLFPFWLVNLAAAFTGVSAATFTLTTFVGIIPGAFVFSSIGNGLNALFEAGENPDLSIWTLISDSRFYVPIIGLAVLSLIPIVYRAFAGKKA